LSNTPSPKVSILSRFLHSHLDTLTRFGVMVTALLSQKRNAGWEKQGLPAD
jgi:hypothetical protein